MKKRKATKEFYYAERDKRTSHAAKVILGIIEEYYEPNSIVDIGGGVGTWVKEAQKKFCIDELSARLYEREYVRDFLVIPSECFKPCNLEGRLVTERRYDIAISLEVAEHLCEKRAASFVEDLTNMSDLILFSAAIPFQGGKGHINEKKLEYWVQLFEEKSYVPFDIVRPIIQNDEIIDYWYKQNIIVFAKKESLAYKSLIQKYKPLPPLSMVSYDLYVCYIKKLFKHPFFVMYQKIKKSDIWKEWIKTKGATKL